MCGGSMEKLGVHVGLKHINCKHEWVIYLAYTGFTVSDVHGEMLVMLGLICRLCSLCFSSCKEHGKLSIRIYTDIKDA